MDFIKQEREKLKELETLLSEKRVSEAEVMVRELVVEFPFSFQVKLLCARVYKEAERLEDSMAILSGLLADDSNNISVLNEIGDVSFRMQRYDEAKDYYNRLMFLDPFNPNAKAAIDMVERIGSGQSFESPEPAAVEPDPVTFTDAPVEEPYKEEKEFDSVSSLREDFFGDKPEQGDPLVSEEASTPETAFFPGEWDLSDPGTPPPVPQDEPKSEEEKLLEKLEDTLVEVNLSDIEGSSDEVRFEDAPVVEEQNVYEIDATPEAMAEESPSAAFDEFVEEEKFEEPEAPVFGEPQADEISFDSAPVEPETAEPVEKESEMEVINPFADTEDGLGIPAEGISFGDIESEPESAEEEPVVSSPFDAQDEELVEPPSFDSFGAVDTTSVTEGSGIESELMDPPAFESTSIDELPPVESTEETPAYESAPVEEAPSFEGFGEPEATPVFGEPEEEAEVSPVFGDTPVEPVIEETPTFESAPVEEAPSFDGFGEPEATPVFGEPEEEAEVSPVFGDTPVEPIVEETPTFESAPVEETPSFKGFGEPEAAPVFGEPEEEAEVSPVFGDTPVEPVIEDTPAFESAPVEDTPSFEGIGEPEATPVFGDFAGKVEVSETPESESFEKNGTEPVADEHPTFGTVDSFESEEELINDSVSTPEFDSAPPGESFIDPDAISFGADEEDEPVQEIDYREETADESLDEISFADSRVDEEPDIAENPFIAETVVETVEDKLAVVEDEDEVSFDPPAVEETPAEDVVESSREESSDINFDLNETPDILSGLHDVNEAVEGSEVDYFGETVVEQPAAVVDEYDEPEIITESAAALYMKQGLYDDAQDVYEKLLLKTGDDKFRLEIEKVKKVKRMSQEIDALENVLEIIKKAGSRD